MQWLEFISVVIVYTKNLKKLLNMDKFLLKSSGSGGPNSNNPGTVPAEETEENSSSSESDQSDYAEAIDATSKLTKKRRLIVRRYDANYLKYGFVCTIVSG